MKFSLYLSSIVAISSAAVALPTLHERTTTTTCTKDQKIAAIQQEIKIISSHSVSDAKAIPLAPDATRTFVVAPTELFGIVAPVNVGFSADTVRLELVALATLLLASVPADSVHYIVNKNGSVTSDFIQLDHIGVLPSVKVREIHDFNDDCQITSILGYVHGNLADLLKE